MNNFPTIGLFVGEEETSLVNLLESIIWRIPKSSIILISTSASGSILRQAEQAKVASVVCDPKPYGGVVTKAYEQVLLSTLRAYAVDYIVLAGIKKVFWGRIFNAYLGRMVCIATPRLPMDVDIHKEAPLVWAGMKVVGSSLHLVGAGGDLIGSILAQTVLGVEETTSCQRVWKRVMDQDRQTIGEGLERFVLEKRSRQKGNPPIGGNSVAGLSDERRSEKPDQRVCLVSACLLGIPCRWDGGNRLAPDVVNYLAQSDLVFLPTCPEAACGLGVPRPPMVLSGGDGEDVLEGKAQVVIKNNGTGIGSISPMLNSRLLEACRRLTRQAMWAGVTEAILKDRSPSCGCGLIHESEGLRPGLGVMAALLARHGCAIRNEKGQSWPKTFIA